MGVATGKPQRSPSACARAVAGCSPRVRTRSGSGDGTAQRAAESGRATDPVTRSAATEVRPRRPRSFQLRTKALAPRTRLRPRRGERASLRPAALAAPSTGQAVAPAALADRRRRPAQPFRQASHSSGPGRGRRHTGAETASRARLPSVRPEPLALCQLCAEKIGPLPPAARGSRCRTTTRNRPRVDVDSRIEPLTSRPGWSGLFPRRGTRG